MSHSEVLSKNSHVLHFLNTPKDCGVEGRKIAEGKGGVILALISTPLQTSQMVHFKVKNCVIQDYASCITQFFILK